MKYNAIPIELNTELTIEDFSRGYSVGSRIFTEIIPSVKLEIFGIAKNGTILCIAILSDDKGHTLAKSNTKEGYLGEWEVAYENNIFSVKISLDK